MMGKHFESEKKIGEICDMVRGILEKAIVHVLECLKIYVVIVSDFHDVS